MVNGDVEAVTKANTDEIFDVEEAITGNIELPSLRYQDQTPSTPIKPQNKKRAFSALSPIIDDDNEMMKKIEKNYRKKFFKHYPNHPDNCPRRPAM